MYVCVRVQVRFSLQSRVNEVPVAKFFLPSVNSLEICTWNVFLAGTAALPRSGRVGRLIDYPRVGRAVLRPRARVAVGAVGDGHPPAALGEEEAEVAEDGPAASGAPREVPAGGVLVAQVLARGGAVNLKRGGKNG